MISNKSIPADELKKYGVDIAGVVNEEFLNGFSESHHKANSGIYTGVQFVTEFDDKISLEYKIQNPIKFDLSPIPKSKFKKIWTHHLNVKGNSSLNETDVIEVPPNLILKTSKINFTVTVFDGNTDNEKLKVSFEWDLEARAAVRQYGDIIKLESIKVEFSVGENVVKNDIKKKLDLNDRPSNVKFGDPSDPVWCAKVEQLILLLLNKILATQISNFINSWELPNSIELVDGVEVSPVYLAIYNHSLITGAQITSSVKGASPLQSEIESLISNYSKRVEEEFSNMSDDDLINWDPDKSMSLSWINEYKNEIEEKQDKELSLQSTRSDKYDPNLALATNDKLFDVLAKQYLSVRDGWEGSKKLDKIVKAEASWWLSVQNGYGRVDGKGINVGADVDIGGRVQVCHFDVDPKNFGKWRCHGPNVNLSPDPDFSMSAFPTFTESGIYLNVKLMTKGIAISIPDWPSWANKILKWVTSMLTRPLLDAIRAIIAIFRVRLAKYPMHFPGTALEWSPRMNSKPDNFGGYLTFTADPKFK
ncbi:MAG TPA: hypothetical protein ENH67_09200 [Pseudoalteromonas sp.]|nr:hypothetical protein [Pseudoalteromonas sp.]HDZ33047.1 hypothetical protein [Pseudoalteromonas sp.]